MLFLSHPRTDDARPNLTVIDGGANEDEWASSLERGIAFLEGEAEAATQSDGGQRWRAYCLARAVKLRALQAGPH